ncbi:hypothetical protein MRY82_08675 [bacterium]|nr:hypothetical protein [bacterium]
MKLLGRTFSFLTVISLFLLSSCNLPPVLATLEATIIDPNDTSGSGSSYAVVNFTRFNGIYSSSNGDAELQFTNPEGDNMVITLGDASVGTYSVGGVTQVNGQITVTRDLEQVTQAFSASAGSITITGIATDGDQVIAVQGSFEINIEGGGGATSRFDSR